MGVYAQLNAQTKTFNGGSPLGTWLASKLAKAGQGGSVDPPVPAAAAATNGVYDVAQATQTSGNMTLTVSVRQANGVVESATTANILFSAVAATVESAIDTALTGVVTGWTNGDVSVSGTAVNNADNIVLTFDGTSVAGRTVTVVLNDVDGAGGAWGAVTVTTEGQTERAALGVLIALNVVTPTVARQDASTSNVSFVDSENRNHNVPTNIVKALMREAAAEDANNSSYHSIDAALFDSQDRSKMVEERVTGDRTRS
jgi:hypothetical protein